MHSFTQQHLSNTFCVPNTVLLTKDIAMDKTDKNVYHLKDIKITHYFVGGEKSSIYVSIYTCI